MAGHNLISCIAARMNLGNNQFYDNVQVFYYARRSLIKMMAEAPSFHLPIGKEDYEEFLQQLSPEEIDINGIPILRAQRELLRLVFAKGACRQQGKGVNPGFEKTGIG